MRKACWKRRKLGKKRKLGRTVREKRRKSRRTVREKEKIKESRLEK